MLQNFSIDDVIASTTVSSSLSKINFWPYFAMGQCAFAHAYAYKKKPLQQSGANKFISIRIYPWICYLIDVSTVYLSHTCMQPDVWIGQFQSGIG